MPTLTSMRRLVALALFLTLSGIVAVGASNTASAQTAVQIVTTPSGLKVIDTQVGTGATPQPGQTCVMHYTGWLYVNGTKARNLTVLSTVAGRLNFLLRGSA